MADRMTTLRQIAGSPSGDRSPCGGRWARRAILALALSLAGCAAQGLLYSRVTAPATRDFDRTPVGSKRLVIALHRVQEPVSGYGISAEWETDRVKMAAQRVGITNLYFADMQTFSILRGIYRKRTLIVYGE